MYIQLVFVLCTRSIYVSTDGTCPHAGTQPNLVFVFVFALVFVYVYTTCICIVHSQYLCEHRWDLSSCWDSTQPCICICICTCICICIYNLYLYCALAVFM